MKDQAIAQLSELITSLAKDETAVRNLSVRYVDNSYVETLIDGTRRVRSVKPLTKTLTIELAVF